MVSRGVCRARGRARLPDARYRRLPGGGVRPREAGSPPSRLVPGAGRRRQVLPIRGALRDSPGKPHRARLSTPGSSPATATASGSPTWAGSFPWPKDSRRPDSFRVSRTNGDWKQGDYLLQHDYDHYQVVEGKRTSQFPGGRAVGAAAATASGARLYFGVKDFWQSYPSELEFRSGSLWFHNWPRHNQPAALELKQEADHHAWRSGPALGGPL